jgi:HAD superfamily hydrolase (TIGR01549 family)
MNNRSRFLTEIKKEIDRAKVVSFDIFDTLLLRPYLRPTDLFKHVGQISDAPLFADIRIQAEANAREKSNQEDILIDDIYAEIDPDFHSFMQYELDLESQVLRANPKIKQIYDYARQSGKKIIIASDMYLQKDFLEKILNREGFAGYDRFYLSSDIGKLKGSGNMFRQIISEMDVLPEQIIHIGDNEWADYKVPKKLGIKAVRIEKVIDEYLAANPHAKKLSENADVGLSVALGLAAERWAVGKSDYWENFGYEIAGPIIYAFAKFIETQAKKQKLDHLLFVARDCYALQKVFDLLGTGIQSHYIYAPRILGILLDLDLRTVSASWGHDLPAFIINFLDKRGLVLAGAADAKTYKDKLNVIEQNRDKIMDELSDLRQDYQNYLAGQLSGGTEAKRTGVIDPVSGFLTAQVFIEKMLGAKTSGLYMHLLNFMDATLKSGRNLSEMMSASRVIDWCPKLCDLIELVMTSPEPPIYGVDANGKPIYKTDISKWEKIRGNTYSKMYPPAIRFATESLARFGKYSVGLSQTEMGHILHEFYFNPTKYDRKSFRKIRHASSGTHNNKEYYPIFTAEQWQAPGRKIINLLYTALFILLQPIKIKMRGIKRFKLFLFPRLKHRALQISFGDSERYAVCVGGIKQGF